MRKRKVKISDFAEVITGGTPSTSVPEYWENGSIPWLQSGACQNCMITDCNTFITQAGLENSAAKMMRKDSVLIALTGATTGKVGYLTFDACANQSVTGIQPNNQFVPKYLYYYLLGIRQKILDDSYGGAQKHISQGYVKNIEVPFGPIDDQIDIVEKLDKVDRMIFLRKQELQAMDDLVKARFVEMFGDPKLNPNGYPVHQLSDYIEFLTSGSRGWAQYCVDDGKEWFITIKNVKDCQISIDNMQPVNAPDNAEAKRTKVHEGDLLISITADLGRTGVVTKEIAEHGAYINQHLTCIRLNRDVLEPGYVAYFMESPAGKEQFVSKNQSAVKAGLNFNSINTLQLMVPPKILQQEFLVFVAQVDKSKVAIQKALEEAQLLFDSLMQQYFG